MDENHENVYEYRVTPPQESGSDTAYDRDSRRYEPGYGGHTPPSPELPQKRKKKGMSTGGIVALALACSLIGGCLGAGGMLLLRRDPRSQTEPESPQTATVMLQGEREPTRNLATADVDTGKLMSASEVYAANVNSTVGITVDITTNYWGYQTTSAASGSGFILSADGYILTNYHVIEDGSKVVVTTYDNKSYDAKVVGYDSGNDIAVLKVDAEDLVPVVLGDSDDLTVGDSVVAIGNPLGELTFSLTHGVVSALDREITLSSGNTMTLIQTDASINSGNSGGPLFNMYGELVGITNAKYSTSSSSSQASIDNIGFAIPINRVRGIVESIIQNGYIVKPYIGVSVATVTAELQSYGIPQGAAIKAVVEGSPAEAAGLQVNDVITQVNGQEISSRSDLTNLVSRAAVGDELTLTVFRQSESEPLTLTVTVGAQQQDALAESKAEQQPQQQQPGYDDGFPFGYGFPFGFGWG